MARKDAEVADVVDLMRCITAPRCFHASIALRVSDRSCYTTAPCCDAESAACRFCRARAAGAGGGEPSVGPSRGDGVQLGLFSGDGTFVGFATASHKLRKMTIECYGQMNDDGISGTILELATRLRLVSGLQDKHVRGYVWLLIETGIFRLRRSGAVLELAPDPRRYPAAPWCTAEALARALSEPTFDDLAVLPPPRR